MTAQRGLLHRNSRHWWLSAYARPVRVIASGSTLLPKSRGTRSSLNRPLTCLARGQLFGGVVSRLLCMYWMWWWLVEFIFLDIVATVALVSGYLAVVISKAVV